MLACSESVTGVVNPNSSSKSTLEKLFTAKTRTFKIDKTDAVVAVVGLQRYLSEDQSAAVQQHQQQTDSYDVTVTDGVWQAKCILDRGLNDLVQRNIIRSGVDIKIMQCTFLYDERRLGHGCVCIEKIEYGSLGSTVLRHIKDLDSVPVLSKDGFGNVALQCDAPLQVGRKHYLPLWNNEDPEGTMWIPDIRPSDVVLDVSKITLLCHLESSLGCTFQPPPLIVRVIHKSRLRYYGKPGLKIDYPYQAYFEVADQSGTMSLVLWNELCPEWYRGLNVGTVLYLQNYAIKQSYPNRSRPHMNNHQMKSFHSVELCLNSRNPTAVLTVVPASSVSPQWGLPDVSYQFTTRSELESLPNNSACDIIGLVTFVSRVERIKSMGNKGPDRYWSYRWIHAVDGTSNIPFILEIYASSQPEIFTGIYPMTYLVCTQMRKCQEPDSLPYLTSSCETQIFTTGFHKGQPYVSDHRVKSFIQWTKTLKDSVMMKKTVVGGHYSFPHAPRIFTQSVADGSAQVPLVAATDLRREMESLRYREHKRLAIQGQIKAVQYVMWPQEVLSDQQTFQSASGNILDEPDPLSDQRTVEVTGINQDSVPSGVPSSPSTRKRKRPQKREADKDLTGEELDAEEEQSDPETEEDVGTTGNNSAQPLASGIHVPSEIPQSEDSAGERAIPNGFRRWESSSWHEQKKEVSDYLRPGGVYLESLSQRFTFDDKSLLLQRGNLHAACWTPDNASTDTLSPAACRGYYKITILGLNQQIAVDAAFLPVMSSGDPRSLGLVQDPHDNTLLSCLSSGFFCPLTDPLCQSETALPEPEEVLATAEELKDTHFVLIIDLCHLGGVKLEVLLTKSDRDVVLSITVMEPFATRYLFPWLLVVSRIRFADAAFIWTAFLNVSFIDPVNNDTMWLEERGIYGQDSPRFRLTGAVFLADPIYGCTGDTVYAVPALSHGWIAFIQRGGDCTFTEKINVASRNGAVAAIIFNNIGTNDVIQMSHPGTEDVVAIMIGRRQGMDIAELINQGIPVSMNIEFGQQPGSWMSHYSVFFVSISFFVVTAATVGYFIFYSARRLNNVRLQNRKQKQLKSEAKKAIRQLQVRTVKHGDEETGPDADTCAVCIDAYKSGDILTVLTCNHFFHKTCIEPWLLEHRTCPMCKCDILKALGVEQPDEEPSHQVEIPTPVLRSFPRVPVSEDIHSETASSGYASVQGTEDHGSPTEESNMYEPLGNQPDPGSVQVVIQPHYDNLAFESDSENHREPRT
ncbi:hypothetical protein DPEC_G00231390 [Dallia pectoralis]|uniref:Uncharacterized protein n=1 Tax=Dallia pectoralis TaxID=75939 RepID=A0ACC2FWW1_DALPE|nr:hypothetical protein DPEC_G00231390 [Dallia pectoralis]